MVLDEIAGHTSLSFVLGGTYLFIIIHMVVQLFIGHLNHGFLALNTQ